MMTLFAERGLHYLAGREWHQPVRWPETGVMLARALLSDASILLLDDAFSALDMKTEATILKNLLALRDSKTILLITQRLPELIQADHIPVLDQGRVIEQGDHSQLMREVMHDEHTGKGWYAQIFRQQARTLSQQNLLDSVTTPQSSELA